MLSSHDKGLSWWQHTALWMQWQIYQPKAHMLSKPLPPFYFPLKKMVQLRKKKQTNKEKQPCQVLVVSVDVWYTLIFKSETVTLPAAGA